MKISQGLLTNILNNGDSNPPNKYTNSYYAIENIININKKKLSKEILLKFDDIKKQFYSLFDVGVMVLERYYYRDNQKLNKYIVISINDDNIRDIKIIDIYIMLEKFFSKIYSLACLISDKYSFEDFIKNDDDKEYLI